MSTLCHLNINIWHEIHVYLDVSSNQIQNQLTVVNALNCFKKSKQVLKIYIVVTNIIIEIHHQLSDLTIHPCMCGIVFASDRFIQDLLGPLTTRSVCNERTLEADKSPQKKRICLFEHGQVSIMTGDDLIMTGARTKMHAQYWPSCPAIYREVF